MRNIFWVCLCLFVFSACSPAGSTSISLPSLTPTLSPTSSPTSPSVPKTAEAIVPSPVPEETMLPSPSPQTTLTEWETIQQQVARLRNLLGRDSDGYAGLTSALEQASPNKEWCAGLAAAIGDFNYVGDKESAQTLEKLKESQGCS